MIIKTPKWEFVNEKYDNSQFNSMQLFWEDYKVALLWNNEKKIVFLLKDWKAKKLIELDKDNYVDVSVFNNKIYLLIKTIKNWKLLDQKEIIVFNENWELERREKINKKSENAFLIDNLAVFEDWKIKFILNDDVWEQEIWKYDVYNIDTRKYLTTNTWWIESVYWFNWQLWFIIKLKNNNPKDVEILLINKNWKIIDEIEINKQYDFDKFIKIDN